MPIFLPARSRRQFLAQSLVAASGVLLKPMQSWAGNAEPSQTWAFFSDTHIAADRAMLIRETNMAVNLERCVKETLALPQLPTGLIVSGDCAAIKGVPADYETFSALIDPIRNASLPVHLLMGNHDDRSEFAKVLGQTSAPSPVENRYVSVIEGPIANLFLLDSLDQVNKTPGRIGETQLKWLEKELDARADKPAIIVLHHNIVLEMNPFALQDSPEVLAVLRPRKHVKACIFGHHHFWNIVTDDNGLHLISLPPTSYVFKPEHPAGWVEAMVQKNALKLKLHASDTTHPENGKVYDLVWRI